MSDDTLPGQFAGSVKTRSHSLSTSESAAVNSRRARPLVALTIAGFDPSSGAGVTADLQTFAAHGLFGTSAVTALTVQNTLAVAAVEPVPDVLILRTLECLYADLPPAGVKIGMLGAVDVVLAVSNFLAAFAPLGPGIPQIPLVYDPVLRSSSGRDLFPPGEVDVLHSHMLPRVSWITPNWQELGVLTQREIRSLEEAEAAAHRLGERHPHLHFVVTGGDQDAPVDLLRLPSGEVHRFPGERVETTSTHGTGCAFSSALLSRLILGDSPAVAVQAAKDFVTEALHRAPGLGHGKGPLNLLWPLSRGLKP